MPPPSPSSHVSALKANRHASLRPLHMAAPAAAAMACTSPPMHTGHPCIPPPHPTPSPPHAAQPLAPAWRPRCGRTALMCWCSTPPRWPPASMTRQGGGEEGCGGRGSAGWGWRGGCSLHPHLPGLPLAQPQPRRAACCAVAPGLAGGGRGAVRRVLPVAVGGRCRKQGCCRGLASLEELTILVPSHPLPCSGPQAGRDGVLQEVCGGPGGAARHGWAACVSLLLPHLPIAVGLCTCQAAWHEELLDTWAFLPAPFLAALRGVALIHVLPAPVAASSRVAAACGLLSPPALTPLRPFWPPPRHCAVFASIGRVVWRDVGPTAVCFRLLMKVRQTARLPPVALPALPPCWFPSLAVPAAGGLWAGPAAATPCMAAPCSTAPCLPPLTRPLAAAGGLQPDGLCHRRVCALHGRLQALRQEGLMGQDEPFGKPAGLAGPSGILPGASAPGPSLLAGQQAAGRRAPGSSQLPLTKRQPRRTMLAPAACSQALLYLCSRAP